MLYKYHFTDQVYYTPKGIRLNRIVAARDFGNIKAGTVGGFIKTMENLSHEGDCWVTDDARVYEDAKVCSDARVGGEAVVRGRAIITGASIVRGYAIPSQNVPIRLDHKSSQGVGHTNRIVIEANQLLAEGLISRDTSWARDVAKSGGNGLLVVRS